VKYHAACKEALERSKTYGVTYVTKLAGFPDHKAYRVVSEDKYNRAGLDDSVEAIYDSGQKIG
jgi:hypothetical protein